jgi:hypothetical protein
MESAPSRFWQEGETVKVGFVRGLEVVKRVPTPGDFAPDAYALWQPRRVAFIASFRTKAWWTCFGKVESS